MANQEHFDILKQGVEVWNAWRKRHREIQPDLSRAELSGYNLREAYLSDTNLSLTDLSESHLNDANLSYANLSDAELWKADLRCAYLYGAHLNNAHLNDADLRGADLRKADLSDADLSNANLIRADFEQANWTRATIAWTICGDMNIRSVIGLETVKHRGPSNIGIDTIYRSGGNISEVFLRSAGVPDIFIEYMRSLVGKPIEFYSCFISYSSKDQDFAQRLYNDLQGNGVRCWFDREDLKIGDKFRMRIDESIRLYDKLLLILSEHSVKSLWVETEVETAFSKEHKTGKLVLFPVKIDNTVEETEEAWAATIHRTRHIGDFTHWKEHDEYQKGLKRLLRDLKQDVTIGDLAKE